MGHFLTQIPPKPQWGLLSKMGVAENDDLDRCAIILFRAEGIKSLHVSKGKGD